MPIRPENRHRYPADWKTRSRFVRFVRARGRCENCGAMHGAPIVPLKCCTEPIFDERMRCLSCGKTVALVMLTTAHVHDHRPEAASLLNLAAWCQRCHNRHDARDRVRHRRERIERESGQLQLFNSKKGNRTTCQH